MSQQEIMNSFEFEEKIKDKELSDRELLEFFARQSYRAILNVTDLKIVIYGTKAEKGLTQRMVETERKQRDNRAMIIALFGIMGAVSMALLSLFINHVRPAIDLLSHMIRRTS